MADFLEYPDVLQEVRGSMNPGRLKLQKDKVIFRNMKTGKVDQYSAEEMEKANWLMRAKGYCLKFVMANGAIHRYDGFKDTEYEKLASFLKKSYNRSLDKKDLSLKGWNWGIGNFIGNTLEFEVGGNEAFEVPLNYVSHSTTSKNEVTLEFHQNDEAPLSLMELRFHIPTDANSETDPVEEFYTKVMQQADIIQATGESIAILSEVSCLTPRGRYDIKIYPTFLQLHGKTFDYKIPYTTILRFFLLPLRDGRQMYFVISLDPPIKQGNTRYPFLILVFSKEVETTLELSLTEEQEETYKGKLENQMSGPEYEIISRIMKTLVNRKITVPGSFVGHTGAQSISCSYKASVGALYPLERGFIFVHKPPIHIRFDEISSVNFARSSGSTRSFDFDIETKNGIAFNFVGMEKDEYGKLYDFVAQKKLRVKNTGDSFNSKTPKSYDGMDSSGDDAGETDIYLERMKREARERGGDSEEESSEDEDYVAPKSGSEVEEEYDTDWTDSDSDEDGEVGEDGEKKKKKKKTVTIREPGYSKKRERKDSGSGKSKGKKRKKDPNAPKKPMTAFFLWMADNREMIKSEAPDMSVTDVGKRGGELWRALGDDEKAKYEEMHKERKEQYVIEMKEYEEKKAAEGPGSGAGSDESEAGSPKPKKKKKSKPSPQAQVPESKGGSGAGFKSKEFISDSESDGVSESDSDEKPLKPKGNEGKKKKKTKKAPKKEEDSGKSSDSEGEVEKSPSPKGRKSRRQAGADAEKSGDLPSDEEIVSGGDASEGSAAGKSASESGED